MNKRFLCAMALSVCAATAAAQPLKMQEQGAVRWLCGGIGLEERDELTKLEPDSDLKLVFAAGARGEYVTNVGVTLIDGQGGRSNFVAQGPICLLKAPAGRYRLEAKFGDAKRTASATVPKAAAHPATLVFRFPELD